LNSNKIRTSLNGVVVKSEKATWRWQGQRIVPLLLAVLMVSCAPQAIEIPAGTVTDNSSQVQQVPTLQSGFEIPAVRYPQPLGTDLSYTLTPGARWGDYAFSDIIPGGRIEYSKPFKVTGLYVGSGSPSPSVGYRSYIETIAGEVHCNNVVVCKQDPKKLFQAAFSQCDLRITNKLNKIQFYLFKAGYCGAGPAAVCYQSILVMDIAKDISPGDYKTDILVFLDGKWLTTLPCVIQVVEPGCEIPGIAAPPPGWTLGPNGPISVTAWEDLDPSASSNYNNTIRVQSGNQTAYRTVEVYLRAPSYESKTMYIPGPLYSAESENATLKLLNMPTDIRIMRILWNEPDYPWRDRPAFLIEIPPHTKPGVYQIEIVVSLKGEYFGKLPLTVDVRE
jgi:hypothetical protein